MGRKFLTKEKVLLVVVVGIRIMYEFTAAMNSVTTDIASTRCQQSERGRECEMMMMIPFIRCRWCSFPERDIFRGFGADQKGCNTVVDGVKVGMMVALSSRSFVTSRIMPIIVGCAAESEAKTTTIPGKYDVELIILDCVSCPFLDNSVPQ